MINFYILFVRQLHATPARSIHGNGDVILIPVDLYGVHIHTQRVRLDDVRQQGDHLFAVVGGSCRGGEGIIYRIADLGHSFAGSIEAHQHGHLVCESAAVPDVILIREVLGLCAEGHDARG